MIDEKKLIERLRLMRDKCCDRAKKGNNINFARKSLNISQIIGIINNQPKIGEWIPCSERLPEEKTNPVTSDFYEYQVTFKSDDVTDIRHYKFGRGHWWNGGGVIDDHVIAWQPLPEPYIGEQHEG